MVPGQKLQARAGLVEIQSLDKLYEKQPVYNIEIDPEHVYEITPRGILVHNSDGFDCSRYHELKTKKKLDATEQEDLDRLENQVKDNPNLSSTPPTAPEQPKSPEKPEVPEAPSKPKGIKNGHLAGKTHPVTGVPFDKDGYPIFDSMGDAKLPKDLIGPHISDTKQFQEATRELWNELKDNPAMQRRFTAEQLEQIKRGEAYIDGFTWHHHQDGSTMQLIDREIHRKTGHSGGRQATGGRP